MFVEKSFTDKQNDVLGQVEPRKVELPGRTNCYKTKPYLGFGREVLPNSQHHSQIQNMGKPTVCSTAGPKHSKQKNIISGLYLYSGLVLKSDSQGVKKVVFFF